MPIGICVTTRAMKKAALARPSASGDSARSWISSGPRTLVEARKNWLATVAATTATRTPRPVAAGAAAYPAAALSHHRRRPPEAPHRGRRHIEPDPRRDAAPEAQLANRQR